MVCSCAMSFNCIWLNLVPRGRDHLVSYGDRGVPIFPAHDKRDPWGRGCIWLQILFYSCVNETTLFSFLPSLLRENGRSLRFPKIFLKKQTRWSNDKTIIELGCRKISWFVSVSQINYLPKPKAEANNWSARHWQITIFCSTSSNNC